MSPVVFQAILLQLQALWRALAFGASEWLADNHACAGPLV